jgi:AcrR family transcriptional regulator
VATQSERRAATRAAVVGAARELFAQKGYAATSVSDILGSAGVSRGAMYHHFTAKDEVFVAVFGEVSTEAIRRATKHVPSTATPREALIAGCLGWLDAIDDPAICQILLIDGPAVLGWERTRALEERSSLGVMRRSISAAVRSGEMAVPSVDLAARLINAVLAEAALHLLLHKGDRARRRQVAAAVTALVNGFAA